jgi:hypothetical protein
VTVHKIDVDTPSRGMRCVEQEGVLEGRKPVTFLGVFKPIEAQRRSIDVTGQKTFDQHPELILFEGNLKKSHEAYLERKRGSGLQTI